MTDEPYVVNKCLNAASHVVCALDKIPDAASLAPDEARELELVRQCLENAHDILHEIANARSGDKEQLL